MSKSNLRDYKLYIQGLKEDARAEGYAKGLAKARAHNKEKIKIVLKQKGLSESEIDDMLRTYDEL